MKNQIIIYKFKDDKWFPSIRRKTIEYDNKETIVEIEDTGLVKVTYVDAGISGHNGDYYDEHESGWVTYAKAKQFAISDEKQRHKEMMSKLKNMKETK